MHMVRFNAKLFQDRDQYIENTTIICLDDGNCTLFYQIVLMVSRVDFSSVSAHRPPSTVGEIHHSRNLEVNSINCKTRQSVNGMVLNSTHHYRHEKRYAILFAAADWSNIVDAWHNPWSTIPNAVSDGIQTCASHRKLNLPNRLLSSHWHIVECRLGQTYNLVSINGYDDEARV